MISFPESKWACLLHPLASALGVIHMVLLLWACRIQELWGHQDSTQISKENLGGQAICISGPEALQSRPDMMMSEAMKVETKIQWKLHKVRYARNVERLLKNLKAENTTNQERGHTDCVVV